MDKIESLYNSKSLDNYCRYLCSKRLATNGLDKDLKHYVLLKLLSVDLSTVENLKLYANTVASNLYNNKYSIFNKEMGFGLDLIRLESISFDIEDDEPINEVTPDIVVNVMDKDLLNEIKANRFPAGDKLFKMYLELKTYRNVSEYYGIPVMTCHRIITKYKKRINETINK